MRKNLSRLCFYISSLFLFLGKFVLSENKHIPITPLPIPGWWVHFKDIEHLELIKDSRLLNAFKITLYKMPNEYCNMIDNMIKRAKK